MLSAFGLGPWDTAFVNSNKQKRAILLHPEFDFDGWAFDYYDYGGLCMVA